MTGRLLASSWRLDGIPSSVIWAAAGLMLASAVLGAAKAGWEVEVRRKNARVAVVAAAWNGLRICFVGGIGSFGFVCILWTVFGLDGAVGVEKAAAIDTMARK